eukprot:TRINITY_DN36275_c0_g1_i1.p1 TRINITY_DN36275_c0_g1~~TRINITY_DN36275_c0_g1_i1.p1  ORF type:complete len:754 (+),score=124.73 TRINITY_DN36275_c0_g1_i1:93-2354(+)
MLSEFVAAAFSSAGRVFDASEQPKDVQQLLKTVRVVRRQAKTRPVASAALMPSGSAADHRHARGKDAPLGECRFPLQELLCKACAASEAARRMAGSTAADALNANAVADVFATPAWRWLHRLLGDSQFFELLVRHDVFLQLPGDRLLQLAGHRQQGPQKPAHANTRKRTMRLSKPIATHFRPSQALVPRQRIFFSAHFAATPGLPAKSLLKKLPASTSGARRLANWIIGPSLGAGQGGGNAAEPGVTTSSYKRRRKRGKRRAGSSHAAGDLQRQRFPTRPRRGPCAVKSDLSGQVLLKPVVGSITEPLRCMLESAQRTDFKELLSRHCPSDRAIAAIAAFERANPFHLPSHLPAGPRHIVGRRCICREVRTELSESLPRDCVCSGGEAELHLMRNFPTLSCAVARPDVANFIAACLEAAVGGASKGADLLGSRKNWRRLLQTATALVHQRRGETLSAHDAVQGLSVKAFQASLQRRAAAAGTSVEATEQHAKSRVARGVQNGKTRPISSKASAELLARLCYYLLSHVVVPLLRAHFYVTDAEPLGTQTVYFRKNVWHLLRSRADCGYIHLCLGEKKRKHRDEGNAAGKKILRQQRQAPTVRWVPKKQGLRPLTNFSSGLSSKGAESQRTQRQTLRVLSHLRAANPAVLGRSLLSQMEVYAPLVNDLRQLLTSARERGLPLKLFVAVGDLRNCYEQIDHSSLVEHVGSLPLERKYVISRVMTERGAGSSLRAQQVEVRSAGPQRLRLCCRLECG